MIAVIFEVELHPAFKQDYLDIAASLKPLLHEIDGFISIERFQSLSDPDKLLSLSFWRDEQAILQWRTLEAHRLAPAVPVAPAVETWRALKAVVADFKGLVATDALDRRARDLAGSREVRAALANRMQSVVNIAMGASLSTVILTVPVMEAMALYTGQPFQMAMTPVQTVMIFITLIVSAINLNDGETNAIEGMTHFVLFATFIMLSLLGL